MSEGDFWTGPARMCRGIAFSKGTDLEVAYNLEGGDLILRVSKGPVLIFRVRPAGAVKEMGDDELLFANSVAPDFIFRMGEKLQAFGLDGQGARP